MINGVKLVGRLKNDIEITKDEDGNELDLTKSSMVETRKFLEKEILHCDMSIFLRTVMLSSD